MKKHVSLIMAAAMAVTSLFITPVSADAACAHKNQTTISGYKPNCLETGCEDSIYCLDCSQYVKEGADLPKDPDNHIALTYLVDIVDNYDAMQKDPELFNKWLADYVGELNYFENGNFPRRHILLLGKQEYIKDKQSGYIKVECQCSQKKVIKYEFPKPEVKATKLKVTGYNKIAAGKKTTLKVTATPAKAKVSYTWKSSNKKVATVTSTGVVTVKAKTGGKTAIITVTDKNSGKKATYKIYSKKGIVKKVAVSGNKSVKVGKTLQLTAKVTATTGANKTVEWVSSNKKYATVTSKGVVKGLKAGKGKTVKITAKATDGSGKSAYIKIKIK